MPQRILFDMDHVLTYVVMKARPIEQKAQCQESERPGFNHVSALH